MSQQVHRWGVQSSPVGARFYRLNNGLSMNIHQFRTHGFSFPCRQVNVVLGYVGDFHPWYGQDVPTLGGNAAVFNQGLDHVLQIAESDVVGDGDDLIALDVGATD